MKNNPLRKVESLQQSNVLYEFSCPIEGCKLLQNVKYIGMTTTTLSRRLTCHLSSGGPKIHMTNNHNIHINRDILVNNTKIINKFSCSNRLAIAEALHIKRSSPSINYQANCFNRILKLFS